MKINHITILVKDNKEAANFYSKILELGEIRIINNKSYWIQIGNIYLHLAMNSGKPVVGTFYHFAVEIENLADYIKKIESKGVRVERDDKQFFVRDLDGNLIELIDSNNQFFKP